jgi:hypothetical protein
MSASTPGPLETLQAAIQVVPGAELLVLAVPCFLNGMQTEFVFAH